MNKGTESADACARGRAAGGLAERCVGVFFLLCAIGMMLAWVALICVAEGGCKWGWAGAALMLGAAGLLAAYRPVWGVYACILLSGISLKLLHGWRDPLDGLYQPVEQAQLSAFGQRINMDSMQASVLFVVACVILFRERERLRALGKLVVPFAPFLVVLGISWLLNGARLYGIKTGASLLTPMLFAAAAYAAIRPERDMGRLEIVFYLSVALSIAVGELGQILCSKPLLTLSRGQFRFCGGTSPPLFCMACVAPLALAYARALRLDWRGWVLTAGLLLLIGTTLARAHLGAAMIALSGGAFLAPRLKLRLFLFTVLLVLLVVFAFWGPVQERSFGPQKLAGYLTRFFLRAEGLVEEAEEAPELDTSGRKRVWQEYWRLGKRRPVIGYGPGSAYQLGEGFEFTDMRTPHNAYLQLFVETGLMGALAYFGALAHFLVAVLRRRRRMEPPPTWADAAVLCLVLLPLLGSVANVLYVQGFPSAVLVVVAVALKSGGQPRPDASWEARAQ